MSGSRRAASRARQPDCIVRLLATFMEQRRPPPGEALVAPMAGVEITRGSISVPDYLALYRAVGEPVQWDERLRMPEDALAEFLRADSTIIHVLRVDGEMAGLMEAVRQADEEVEIANFGLVPAYQGRRLGPYLLDFALRSLWREPIRRIWLHTDTNDHPKAVRTYLNAGFAEFERKWLDFPD
jgi:ribosomal protein S18 acetylase RimI-like enzyme